MKSREEIYDIYVQDYPNFKKVSLIINPKLIPNEETIYESIKTTEMRFKDRLPEIVLNNEEKEKVINKIKSIYSIFQEEGHAILGDYNHDYKWYENWLSENNDRYYFNRYKSYLIDKKHFSPNIVDILENKTLKSIMSYLGNPNDKSKFSIRGLVVGDVQSGKTSNYLGLVTKAADAGYKVIFILTGTIESLRKQTQERVEEGFVGYDVDNAEDVGVCRGEKTPKCFTSRSHDFVSGNELNTFLKINNNVKEPMVFVLKKNVSVLKKLYSSLKSINTYGQFDKINTSLLLIDDEADNASVNTNKEDNDPTKINKCIRKILSLFERNSYVGFTATPFANVFISYDDEDEMLKDDLFPRDFIYSLNAPSNYCGPNKYFYEDNNNLKFIKDVNDNIFPKNHKKDWYGEKLFPSLYHAINCFLIANTIRDLRDINTNTNRSMLINMTRFTKVQSVIEDIVENYFDSIKNAIKQTFRLDSSYSLSNPLISNLKESFDEEYSEIIINGSKITWDDVFSNIYKSIKDIKIIIVNSSKQSTKLNYDEYKNNGLRVIAIGGLALSRGLTLEGLCISYFYRNSSTFDVLMQMGRWFGYREGYGDICKIFMTENSAEFYRNICDSIEDLRKDIIKMGEQHKKPLDYGIRVRNDSFELGITASNKMRNTKIKFLRRSFYGNIFETPYLDRDLDIIEKNINSTFLFFKKIDLNSKDNSVAHPYFRNIPKKDVVELLKELIINEANENFDTKQLLAFLDRKDKELEKFDLLIMEGYKTSNKKIDIHELNIAGSPLVTRCFDIKNGSIVRINQTRARLGGRLDAKNGLSNDECSKIDDNSRGQEYMIKERNPLLIIYFIDPRNDGFVDDQLYTSTTNFSDDFKLYIEMMNRKYKFLIGYAIGFPKKDGTSEENIMYTVNKKVNYFDKEHDEYGGDDSNE